MRRSRKLFPVVVVPVVLAFVPSLVRAEPVDLELVSQDVSVDTANMTATFKLTFDQPPEFVAADDGQPQAFQYEIDADTTTLARPIEWSDVDTIIRGTEIWEGQGIPVRDRDGEGGVTAGGWGPVRAMLPFDVEGSTVSFTAGLSALGDDDGKFRYRLITTNNGELTGQAVGAVIPLPAAVWTGLTMLGGIGVVRKIRWMPRI